MSERAFSAAGDARLRADEGYRPRAYPDPLSGGAPWTCGIGCTGPDIDAHTVWDAATIEARYLAAKGETFAFLDRQLPWWRGLDGARRDVLVNMAFQLRGKLLRFKRCLAALKSQDYDTAATEMLDSDWARQVPARARRLAAQMRAGAASAP